MARTKITARKTTGKAPRKSHASKVAARKHDTDSFVADEIDKIRKESEKEMKDEREKIKKTNDKLFSKLENENWKSIREKVQDELSQEERTMIARKAYQLDELSIKNLKNEAKKFGVNPEKMDKLEIMNLILKVIQKGPGPEKKTKLEHNNEQILSKSQLNKMTVVDLKKHLKEINIEESLIKGTGSKGNVLKRDIIEHILKSQNSTKKTNKKNTTPTENRIITYEKYDYVIVTRSGIIFPKTEKVDQFQKEISQIAGFSEFFDKFKTPKNPEDGYGYELTYHNDKNLSVESIETLIKDIISLCKKYGYKFDIIIKILEDGLFLLYWIVKNNKIVDATNEINELIDRKEKNTPKSSSTKDKTEQFIVKFTEFFLAEFFGALGLSHFNIDKIAEESSPKIVKRINKFKKIARDEPELVKSVLKHGFNDFSKQTKSSEFDENDWFELRNLFENLFVTDLFTVTSKPIKYANKLNKGEYPNGDLFGGPETEINLKYNSRLLEFASKGIL